MIKRSDYGYYGGLLVFPGGGLIPQDADPGFDCTVPKKQEDLSLRICGIRETFEETGLLLTKPFEMDREDRNSIRQKIISNPNEWLSFCRNRIRRPCTDSLVYWSNWKSPRHHPNRFDTYFYLAKVDSQRMSETSPDEKESVETVWSTPKEILNRFRHEEISLLPPQYCQLVELSQMSWKDLDNQPRVDTIEPVLVEKTNDTTVMKLPDTGRFSGILRLRHKNTKLVGIKWNKESKL
jgi:8-oxo-dGTP pyrophosphatase MutT (NUDIX family)